MTDFMSNVNTKSVSATPALYTINETYALCSDWRIFYGMIVERFNVLSLRMRVEDHLNTVIAS